MIVLCVITKDGKAIGVKTDRGDYTLDAIHNNSVSLDNATIIRTKNGLAVRGKAGVRLKFKEVDDNVKRNESNLGKVSKSKSELRRSNGAGGIDSKGSNIRSGQREANRRRERSTGVTDGGRPKGTQVSSGRSLQSVSVRLSKLDCEVYIQDNPKTFQDDFHNARLLQKDGACVDEHSLEDLSKMKLLRSNNGFVAVESNGNINSVLRDTRKPKTDNFLRDLIVNAIYNGGCKLDCFAITINNRKGGLAKMYCKYGFIPVVKDHFNRDFAPDGWNYERDGEPDVVFMYHCGDSIETVIKKSSNDEYKAYLDYDVPYITDVPQYIKPSDDYDWEEDKDDLSTYSQALRYRDWKYEQYCKIM